MKIRHSLLALSVPMFAACDKTATAPAATAPAATAPAPAAPAPTPSPTNAAPAPAPSPTNAAPAPAPTAPLAVGDAAPDATLLLHDGTTVTLASLRGSRVLVYFYPKDDTPGCTVEAQGLRDRHADLAAAGIKVFGVSVQGADSHKAFIDKHALPFPLVADTDAKVATAFRVPLIGPGLTKRQSFLIGKDGRLEAVWLDVDPSTHAADVLAALPR